MAFRLADCELLGWFCLSFVACTCRVSVSDRVFCFVVFRGMAWKSISNLGPVSLVDYVY